MSAGRDDWEDDNDAVYDEDSRPPQRPGGNRSMRREPSFGPSDREHSNQGPPPRAPSPQAQRSDDDWDEVDRYEDRRREGGTGRNEGPSHPRKRRRVVPIILALIFLCAFGAIAWYGYNWSMKGGTSITVPLITADRDEIKEEPAAGEEGGTQAPYQDVEILNNEGGDEGPESILPGPETPEPVPDAPVPEAPATEITTENAGTPESANDLPPPPPPPSSVGEMEAVQPTPETVPEPVPVAEPAPDVAVEEPAPAPAPALQLADVPAGAVVIQLAAVRSVDAANSEWTRMQSSHEELLGDMPLLMQEIDIEDRGTFFRIQTGPFPNRATAQDICAQLKAAGQDCIVKTR